MGRSFIDSTTTFDDLGREVINVRRRCGREAQIAPYSVHHVSVMSACFVLARARLAWPFSLRRMLLVLRRKLLRSLTCAKQPREVTAT
jgi:hypothetical protein